MALGKVSGSVVPLPDDAPNGAAGFSAGFVTRQGTSEIGAELSFSLSRSTGGPTVNLTFLPLARCRDDNRSKERTAPEGGVSVDLFERTQPDITPIVEYREGYFKAGSLFAEITLGYEPAQAPSIEESYNLILSLTRMIIAAATR